MLAPKLLSSASNSTNLNLPTVSKTIRRRLQSSPTPSYTSMASTNTSENVSELKAKYTDYAMWLKASSRQNREPLFTHELLKHSLCQMGIDSVQAGQLVSTCSWYVYQFQKELDVDTDHHDQSILTETEKQRQSSKRQHKKTRRNKSKKIIPPRERSAAVTTTTSINKENLVSPGPPPPTRSKYFVFPAIHANDLSISPRSRHVDFDNEQTTSQSVGTEKPSHWRSAILKARILPKLRPSDTDAAVHDITPDSALVDLDLSSSQKLSHRNGGHTRSILRKQISSCSSVRPTNVNYRRNRGRLLTPASSIIDEIPLGTKSQRLFGGSECFAQIMNELEEQQR